MPRVKIDCIVSFSSEDPEHPASNLLATEVTKKKWLCRLGESSCSVVLGLSHAVKIGSLQVCAHHAALVEVLVSRAEASGDSYKVLVASSVFLSPTESRRSEEGVERLRSFPSGALCADTCGQCWDRVRIVCSQPYNKHCKFGLSFVQIFSDEAEEVTSAVPKRMFALDTHSSDEEESFRPGELFAQYTPRLSVDTVARQAQSTSAQIREATSNALKNISPAAPVRTSLNKDIGTHKRKKGPDNDDGASRRRGDLLYTDDDLLPHARIDSVVQKHKEDKNKIDRDKPSQSATKKIKLEDIRNRADGKKEGPRYDQESKIIKLEDKNKRSDMKKLETPQKDRGKERKSEGRTEGNKYKDEGKEKYEARSKGHKRRHGARSTSPHRLLEDVQFVLSGYENPERGQLRDLALAMGATYCRDWRPGCTHLICAFPNTPKLRAVRAAAGDAAVVVTGGWLRRCSERRRREPWQHHATEPALRRQLSSSSSDTDPPPSDCDTDDEIQIALDQQSKLNPVTSLADKKTTAGSSTSDSDNECTDEEKFPAASIELDRKQCLPDFLEGHTFVVADDVEEIGFDVALLKRYLRAYGGDVVECPTSCSAVLSARPGEGSPRLRPDWLWACHKAGAYVPHDNYLIT